MSEIRLLPGMKFMFGGVLYKPGDILSDTEETRKLLKRKKAEWAEAEEEEEEEETPPAVIERYEAETVKALTALAKKRGISIPKGTNKAEIIELLTVSYVDCAENDGDGGDEGDA
ncbi:MAG: hypothetical protein LBS00_03870 [Synergistaceae bacterium]|jgi:hypothetical protein|nr:hypothetical protein [Synergistaceae bacterium]